MIRRVVLINNANNSYLSKIIRNLERKKFGRMTILLNEHEISIIMYFNEQYNDKDQLTPPELKMVIFLNFEIFVSYN